MASAQNDFSKGSVVGNIMGMAIPMTAAQLINLLYNVVDRIYIGHIPGVGAAALTGVGVCMPLIMIVTAFAAFIGYGGAPRASIFMGKGDHASAEKTLGNCFTAQIVISAVLTAVLLLWNRDFLMAFGASENTIEYGVSYMNIYSIGTLFVQLTLGMNAFITAQGFAKTGMLSVLIGAVANIILDYIFIGLCHFGPAGAALGTTVSQAISVIVSLFVIVKRKTGISLKPSDFRPKRNVCGTILKIGIPIACQDGLIQIAFIIITIIANKRGLTDSAAVGIVEKVISFLFLVPSSMLSTVSALGAQNIGAGKPERAKLTLRYAIFITAGFGLIVAIIIQFIAEPVVGLFTTDNGVILAGGQYLRGYIWDCMFAGIHFSFSGYFCACQKSILSFIHNIIAISLVRVPGVYLTSKLFSNTLFPMGLATATGSLMSVIICVIAFMLLARKEKLIA